MLPPPPPAATETAAATATTRAPTNTTNSAVRPRRPNRCTTSPLLSTFPQPPRVRELTTLEFKYRELYGESATCRARRRSALTDLPERRSARVDSRRLHLGVHDRLELRGQRVELARQLLVRGEARGIDRGDGVGDLLLERPDREPARRTQVNGPVRLEQVLPRVGVRAAGAAAAVRGNRHVRRGVHVRVARDEQHLHGDG